MAGSWNGLVFTGDDTNDTASGTDANESLLGNKGDDSLSGGGGDDTVDGGVGNDNLNGNSGDDRLIDVGSIPFGYVGLIGHDTLRGGSGDDLLEFRSPDTGDFAYGDAGLDTVLLDFRSATAIQRVSLVLGPNTVVKLDDINTVGLLSIERVIFTGGLGDDFITGGDKDDRLTGGLGAYLGTNDGNDVLNGLGGDDWIEGGTGIQLIDGGKGDDTASFDLSAAGDAFTIKSGKLIDLGAWGSVKGIENLYEVKTSSGNDVFKIDQLTAVDITSGGGDDKITVADGGASVDAGLGDDIVRTGAGNDYVVGGAGADTVYLGDGDDQADTGGGSRATTEAEKVFGEGGDDNIYTAAGADRLDGGGGDDDIFAGGGADVVEGGEGNDTIHGEGGADRIAGGGGDDTLDADYDYWTDDTPADADVLDGGDGADKLTGGRGLDTLIGGLGDDTLTVAPILEGNVIDTAVDKLNGGEGLDTLGFSGFGAGVAATLELVLGATTDIVFDGKLVASATRMERLDISSYGTGKQVITGGKFADTIRTGSGDDTITTLGGNDTVQGLDYGGTDSNTIATGDGDDSVNIYLGGNDSVDMGSGNDTLTLSNVSPAPGGLSDYKGGTGTDSFVIYTRFGAPGVSFDGVSIRAGATVIGTVSGFEALSYYGSSDVFAFTGTKNADRLEFDAANDTASGGGGDDVMLGGGGSDTLDGGNGNDRLTGGTGQDFLTGSGGGDSFVFLTAGDSAVGDARDQIIGFETGIDKVDLSAIFNGGPAGVFSFIGADAFSAAGQVRAIQQGGHTVIQINTFGVDTAESEILLKGFTAATLLAGDFNL